MNKNNFNVFDDLEIDIISFEDDWSRNPQAQFKQWKEAYQKKIEVSNETTQVVPVECYVESDVETEFELTQWVSLRGMAVKTAKGYLKKTTFPTIKENHG